MLWTGCLGLSLFFRKQIIHFVVHLTGAGQTLQLELADKTTTALGQCEFEGLLQLLRQRRQILVHQLLLQSHCGCGDQHTRSSRQRHADGRNAVGQRFSNPCSGLHHGNGAAGIWIVFVHFSQLGLTQRLRDLGGHFSLSFTTAKSWHGANDLIKGIQSLFSPLFFMHFSVF